MTRKHLLLGVSALFFTSAAVAAPIKQAPKYQPTIVGYALDPFGVDHGFAPAGSTFGMDASSSNDLWMAHGLSADEVDHVLADASVQHATAQSAYQPPLYQPASTSSWSDDVTAEAQPVDTLPLAGKMGTFRHASAEVGWDEGTTTPATYETAAYEQPRIVPRPETTYRACEGPSDDSCIQLHERGVSEAYAEWQNGGAQLAQARADQANQYALNERADPNVRPASYSADASMSADEPLDVSQAALSDLGDDTVVPSDSHEELTMI